MLGFNPVVEEHTLEEGVLLEVKAEDAGRLIGRQGQTLTELQYILNRLLFHQDSAAPRVTVDVGGYRAQARDALVNKAKEAAEKVRRWGDIVELEPMNAFDRRVVHNASFLPAIRWVVSLPCSTAYFLEQTKFTPFLHKPS